MQVKAILRNLRISPRKTREVIDLIRGKNVAQAKDILLFTTRKSAPIVLKLLNSAIANAKNNFNLNESNLYVYSVTADEGTKLKRWHPMSRGRAYSIKKRTSHITIILSDKKVVSKKEKIKLNRKLAKKKSKI